MKHRKLSTVKSDLSVFINSINYSLTLLSTGKLVLTQSPTIQYILVMASFVNDSIWN